MARILIVDDEKMITSALASAMKKLGHEPFCANTLKDALSMAHEQSCDVVFLDVQMPDGSGLDVISQIANAPSAPEVIIITGQGNPDGATLAINNGAWDYIEKPLSMQKITLPLTRVLQYREGKAGRRTRSLQLTSIIGSSPPMRACYELLAQAADGDMAVLITGETGTGKELFARAIHENSRRAKENFVVLDCTALPANLVESVLFGHEKGSFTGADRSHVGLIKQADRGTLFLDEVGELPMPLQKAFLRVLQERRFRPVGGSDEIESNFRLVAATNSNLHEMIGAGQFREDLLYRISALRIMVPPLRERKEDIKELTGHYIVKICERYGMEIKGINSMVYEELLAYSWPGNVRELINSIERALVAAKDEPTLFHKHLPTGIRVNYTCESLESKMRTAGSTALPEDLPTIQQYRLLMEKKYLLDLLPVIRADIKKACAVSGLSRSRLYGLLKEHEIEM